MNRLRIILVLLWGIFLFLGCQPEWGEPEFKVEDWVPPAGTQNSQFWTINSKNVLGKHQLNTPPDSLTDYRDRFRYIRAVVVSSDEGGNYYKAMVVQDSTGGVELELDMTGLYNTYPVGQKIVIVCNGLDKKGNGLVIGDYNNLPQIGWIYQKTQVGRVNSLFLDNYIIKDGLPSLKNLPRILTNNDIDFSSDKDINKLVRLENVTFKENAIGQPFSYHDFTTDWIVYVPLADGSTREVTVRTSNYAKFRSMVILNKEYNLTGILTKYRNSYQLMIRTKEDIEPPKPSESLTFVFVKDPLQEGWSTQSLLGNSTWSYRTSSQFMLHLGNSNGFAMDDWFISPEITYPYTENGFLIFEHELPVLNDQKDAYQIYYTTSTSATFNINDWKPLGTLSKFPEQFEWSNKISLSGIKSNTFKIAFRYNAPNPAVETYSWSIRKVEISNN